ncbi:MAG TPA: ATP-binding cassette domain-containing protein [Bryobacteraceae bacterium]|jgi:phospholipid/cholesterol/gamma-HCH transport system ATP-binding protein|nr:ATP-binding cassette domain-containing protein [Bryobacteraceae bacterium]
MSGSDGSAISFQQVSKSFGNRQVLKDVSFDVAPGEALCVMGRSGTGKSVTLKLMIGLMKPDAGAVCIENQNIVDLDEDGLSKVRRHMGFLFQSAALFDSFSLNDNLAVPLERLAKKAKDEIDSLVQETLDEVGLGKDRYKMPAELSGGMRKRAGLARALVLDPRILLIDEPSSGLDRVTSSEIDDLLLRLKQKNKTTMVIVTHDVQGARRVGDRLAVLDQGRLAAIGKADELEKDQNKLVRALVSEAN